MASSKVCCQLSLICQPSNLSNQFHRTAHCTLQSAHTDQWLLYRTSNIQLGRSANTDSPCPPPWAPAYPREAVILATIHTPYPPARWSQHTASHEGRAALPMRPPLPRQSARWEKPHCRRRCRPRQRRRGDTQRRGPAAPSSPGSRRHRAVCRDTGYR